MPRDVSFYSNDRCSFSSLPFPRGLTCLACKFASRVAIFFFPSESLFFPSYFPSFRQPSVANIYYLYALVEAILRHNNTQLFESFIWKKKYKIWRRWLRGLALSIIMEAKQQEITWVNIRTNKHTHTHDTTNIRTNTNILTNLTAKTHWLSERRQLYGIMWSQLKDPFRCTWCIRGPSIPPWCRDTPVSRAAVRLIAVAFLVWRTNKLIPYDIYIHLFT